MTFGLAPSPPLQGAQRMPSHCLPDSKCQLRWHLPPTVTAPNRFGNLLQPPILPLLEPPPPSNASLMLTFEPHKAKGCKGTMSEPKALQ